MLAMLNSGLGLSREAIRLELTEHNSAAPRLEVENAEQHVVVVARGNQI